MSNGADIAALLAHTEWTRALARRLAGDAQLAEDLVQDLWVAALERPPRTDRPLRGWLAALLRHRTRDHWRARVGRERCERMAAQAEVLPSSDELVERASVQRALVEAVLALDEPYRATVLLRFFEGLPPRVIARRSGTSLATVNSRLARALGFLRERLARGGGRDAWLAALVPLLREPVPAALLGIPVMKTVSVLFAASVLVGLFLWRSPAEPRLRGSDALPPPAALTEQAPDRPDPSTGGTEARNLAPVRESRPPDPKPAGVEEPAPVLPATRRASGRVLDVDGNGIAFFELVLSAGENGGKPSRCTSGPGGWFEIALGQVDEEIVAADPAFATVLAGVVRTLEETRPLVVVAPRLELAGLVIDSAGVPVSGAEVVFELPPGFGNAWGLAFDHALAVGWRTRSTRDGRFELADVPGVPGARVRASLGGFERHEEPAPGFPTRAHVIVLHRPERTEGLVQGVVLDPSGAPVEGARVAARAESTLTQSDGTFTLDLLQRGARPPLVAVQPGYEPAVFEPERGPRGEPRWPSSIVLRLGGPPSELSGRVVDHRGDPVAGARVWLDDPTPFGDLGRDRLAAEGLARGDERFWSYALTGSDGGFRLGGLLARRYRVKAIDPRNLLEAERPNVAAVDSPVELVLPTQRLHARVAGRVVDARGVSVAGALVRLFRTTFRMELTEGRQSDALQAQAQLTDANGAFEFHAVPPDVGLIATGDTILFAWGEVAGAADVESLEIVARRRLQLQVELAPPRERADAFRVLDVQGRELVLTVERGEGPFYGPRMELLDGRSAVVSLDEDAATLVLLRAGETVARVPLNLVPGEVNLVRP